MRWPAALPSSAFGRWGAALLAPWLFALVLGPALADALGLALHAHDQPFADTRSWLGVPHAMDVFSYAPLLAAGLWGLLALALLSAPLPAASDNVLPWAVVQFGGMALLACLGQQAAANGRPTPLTP